MSGQVFKRENLGPKSAGFFQVNRYQILKSTVNPRAQISSALEMQTAVSAVFAYSLGKQILVCYLFSHGLQSQHKTLNFALSRADIV